MDTNSLVAFSVLWAAGVGVAASALYVLRRSRRGKVSGSASFLGASVQFGADVRQSCQTATTVARVSVGRDAKLSATSVEVRDSRVGRDLILTQPLTERADPKP